MGCMASTQRVASVPYVPWSGAPDKSETVATALTRLDDEIARSEKTHPSARLAVVTAEMESIHQEIKTFEETTRPITSKDGYAKTIHQLFISLDLYRRPVLATDNEDFIANVNRKEMRRLELTWLRERYGELQRERRVLHAQLLRMRSLYAQLNLLLDSVWNNTLRPGTPLETALSRALALRDALASVSARLRAAAEHAHAAVRLLDNALPAWKLTSVGKSGWERTSACADACRLLVSARCGERGARRVLSAPAAPRAARMLRLALDYAFTDALHDYKYQRATEIFVQFKEALVQLINSIHQVPSFYTIIQAIRSQGISFPSFCYHERLSIAGNCRMCLVNVEGMWKPQIACGVQVAKNMKIRTNNEITLKAQESVIEFILADHPLDCPICDQGGECDLQDLTMKFGNDRSRYTDIHFDGKRAVENKYLGPLIRTSMNRCIHCTRCIRFASQVCGLEVLGTTGRGHDMLVGTYVDKMFLSELSGNVVDLCPVGSLTSGPYMFKARAWELKSTNSIDVTDATGTNIVINHRFDRVQRILPREHDEVNQEWLSDKGRWAFDSTEMQRLVTPMYRCSGNLCPIEWEDALDTASCMIKGGRVAAVAGPHSNIETLIACKDLLNALGSESLYYPRDVNHSSTGADLRCAYSLNIPMKNIPKADRIILIGTNPRFEAPILNVWIRQAYRTNECDIIVLGPKADYNYYVDYMCDICDIPKVLSGAKAPLVFIGMDVLSTPSGGIVVEILSKCCKNDPKWPVINFVPREASFNGALEVGYQPTSLDALTQSQPDVLILMGCDDFLNTGTPPAAKCDVIYVGFQGDLGANCATLILPGSAYTEAGGTFMNMECRPQYASPAVTPPGKARYDWKIFRALAEYCGINLFYDDQDTIECRMSQISPALMALDIVQKREFSNIMAGCSSSPRKPATNIDIEMKSLKDYYCSDVFTFNSPTMLKARKAADEYAQRPYAQN